MNICYCLITSRIVPANLLSHTRARTSPKTDSTPESGHAGSWRTSSDKESLGRSPPGEPAPRPDACATLPPTSARGWPRPRRKPAISQKERSHPETKPGRLLSYLNRPLRRGFTLTICRHTLDVWSILHTQTGGILPESCCPLAPYSTHKNGRFVTYLLVAGGFVSLAARKISTPSSAFTSVASG